jgi:hypothetical protein
MSCASLFGAMLHGGLISLHSTDLPYQLSFFAGFRAAKFKGYLFLFFLYCFLRYDFTFQFPLFLVGEAVPVHHLLLFIKKCFPLLLFEKLSQVLSVQPFHFGFSILIYLSS